MIDARSVLDDLWSTQLIPFKLSAHHIESLEVNEYRVCFCDSRLYSVDVSGMDEESLRHVLRVNLLARIAGLEGPWQERA